MTGEPDQTARLTETESQDVTGQAATRARIVDCDVHPHFAEGIADLMPFLPRRWKERIAGSDHSRTWAARFPGSAYAIPGNTIYTNPAGAMRRDAVHDGRLPASDPAFVAEQLLDRHGIDRAILLGGNVFGLAALPDASLATALASAYNEWVTERWLLTDKRYRASILVAPQDPTAAVKEVERLHDRNGMVQIHMPLGDRLLGEPQFHPIYEAAASFGLPVCIHPNATEGMYWRAPNVAGGPPTYYLEWVTLYSQAFAPHLTSLICHGVFEQYPRLRVVLAEAGFAWLPDLLWRLNRYWTNMRADMPNLTRLPSEYVRQSVRFTTQPFPETSKKFIRKICSMVWADTTLLFSSDYPHWDFDDPVRVLAPLEQPVRDRILTDNASELYGERL